MAKKKNKKPYKCGDCAFMHTWKTEKYSDKEPNGLQGHCMLYHEICGAKCEHMEECNQYIKRHKSDTLAVLAKIHAKLVGEKQVK